MTRPTPARRYKATLMAAALTGMAITPLALANGAAADGAAADGMGAAAELPLVAMDRSSDNRVWQATQGGDENTLLGLIENGLIQIDGLEASVRESLDLFRANYAKRELSRAEKIAEVNQELNDQIAAFDADRNPISLSDALSNAVRLQLLTKDDDAFFADTRVQRLARDAEQAAREAEKNSDWMIASELFFRLDSIFDTKGNFREDVQRLGKRLSMIRLYAPERLWELRNNRRLAEDLGPLPAYNPYGDEYTAKLNGISSTMIRTAIQRSAQQHVGRVTRTNPEGVTMNAMILGGIDAVRTMATTTDLSEAFPGLGDNRKRQAFLDRLAERRGTVSGWTRDGSAYDLRRVIDAVLSDAQDTVALKPEVVLHEFGNGAMGELDDYSAFIWPDELARFRRSTEGEFIGVGIQIQLDELQNITVVTPLEGTPAQRAGVRSGDVIKKINGISAIGLGLDQAVEVITGPANTPVALTVERSDDDDNVAEITFDLIRQRIDLPTIRGWAKTGSGDQDWEWFVDPEHEIGYIRLSGFTNDSATELDRAVSSMREQGLQGLILDLRYNPGGLLDQAVEIASRFVPAGMIVKTVDAMGIPQEQQNARQVASRHSLTDIPVVILINEGSASASEIVAGAVQAGARAGKNKALIVGQRSFGKGSVQNVFMLPGNAAAMKLTTHYYRVDSTRMIHRLPGATEWGVDPDVTVEMLPAQQEAALRLRRDADILPLDENGRIITTVERPDPNTLLTDGIDLQIQTALVLLQTQNLVAEGIASVKE